MLRKRLVFKIVKDALSRKSLRPFKHIQESFDHHLQLSLDLIDKRQTICRRLEVGDNVYDRVPSHEGAQNHTSGERKDHTGADLDVIGIDVLKPFEIVMGFQVLAMKCASEVAKLEQIEDHEKFRYRLHALLSLACHHIEGFSFVRLSLILNSLANIIRWHRDVTDSRPPNSGGDRMGRNDFCSVPADRLDSIFGGKFSADPEGNDLELTFKRFHALLETRFMLHLCLYEKFGASRTHEDPDVGHIDAHSVCLLLKYYLVVGDMNRTLFYLILRFIRQQSQFELRDVMNMVVSLSMMDGASDLYSPVDLQQLHAAVSVFMEHNISDPSAINLSGESSSLPELWDNETVKNRSLVELLLITLAEKEPTGGADLHLCHLYIKALMVFRDRGVPEELLAALASDALKNSTHVFSSGDVLKGRGFDKFVAYLQSIKICVRDSSILEPAALQSFFLDEQVQRRTLSSLLRLAKEPSNTNVKSLVTLCDTIKFVSAIKNTAEDHAALLTHLRSTLSRVLPVIVLANINRFKVGDIVAVYEYLHDDMPARMEVQKMLFNLYANLNSGDNTPDVLDIYTETTTLMTSFHKHNYKIDHAVHNQISSWILGTYKIAGIKDVSLLLRFLQSTARICKIEPEIFIIYDFNILLNYVFEFDVWKGHVIPLVDIIYNLLPHWANGFTDALMKSNLVKLLEHYHLSTIVPMAVQSCEGRPSGKDPNSDRMSPLDISTFAKYTHLVWSLRNTSPVSHELWDRHQTVIVDGIYNCTNIGKLSLGDDGPVCSNKNTNVKKCEMWQSFSVRLMVEILLDMHRQHLGSSGADHSALPKEQRAMSFLCRELLIGLDVFDDHAASMTQLLTLILENEEHMPDCPHFTDLVCKLNSVVSAR
ncbi:hypothetical protein, conserved [Babesia bigemina]|uniref:Uncharacterized protein n=1 Tax=Babesia bigemina TaxID=5866 RepID=A0A061D5B4_BABBI|nr:hypothetical protein, conserved [Babesia bigemina]CDR95881.1 hypothetical protein, conserved [Babesia bigemina]|eukprot:XP_012768067.1 hypothetical protein, conserved [Babesia bigemina]